MFSGEDTDTEEHVIPRWMQNRFGLWNQSVTIPNGTRLSYKFMKVPVASKHNAKFGEIEHRISNGHFIPQEVYLWALKIHIGFIFRDASLRMARDLPSAGFILDLNDFASEISVFRKLYAIWARGGEIDPDPFGTVIILDALGSPSFDLMHCYGSGTVVLQLGDKILYVSLWDQADGMYANFKDVWNAHHVPFVNGVPEEHREAAAVGAHHVWSCETSYWLLRQRRSMNFISTDKTFLSVPPLTRLPGRAPNQQELSMFCKTFGLRLRLFNGEVGNVFETVWDPFAP